MKEIGIFGSTGSIGRSALDVVRRHPEAFHVRLLAAHRNHELLCAQVREFRPAAVAVADPEAARAARHAVGDITEVLPGIEGLRELARRDDYRVMVSALVGFAGMLPTVDAIRAGRDVALANKETLVAAGGLVMALVNGRRAALVPVDSEHSAIHQCLAGEPAGALARIMLTASGGPFRDRSAKDLATVTVAEALRHPNWRMGRKITVDSATLMNKGFEVIEAHWLFGLPPEAIDVFVHRQSIVHSLVEFVDGSVKAQLGVPDMRLPIHYALSYPDRIPAHYDRLDLARMRSLTFEEPDTASFRCLPLAYAALREGGSAPTALNAANEIAVAAFLDGRIRFVDIPSVIEECLGAMPSRAATDVNAVVDADREARVHALRAVSTLSAAPVTVA